MDEKENSTKHDEVYDLLSDWKFLSIIQFGKKNISSLIS